MHNFEIQTVFSDIKSAVCAEKALRPELGKAFEKRSKTSIQSNKNVVSLKIIASDASALNASKSSFERLLLLCKRISLMDRRQ